MRPQPNPKTVHEREQASLHASTPTLLPAAPLCLAVVHALAVRAPDLTVSLFLPTHRAGSSKHQDHIRLNNLIHEAQRIFDSVADAPRAELVMKHLKALIEHPGFWAHPQDGLAIFCNTIGITYLWTPQALSEQVIIGERCHIKPLVPLLAGDGRFYLLELSQHGVHFHIGSHRGLVPIELPGVPASVDEDQGVHDEKRHAGVRTVQAGGSGTSRHFGTDSDDRAKDRIRHYFRQIDSGVRVVIHDDHAPLVLAGVDFLHPLYAEVNHYPHLIKNGIAGNPDLIPTPELHQRAWTLVEPQFRKGADEARERCTQLHGTARASGDLASILRASKQGRVSDLMVASDRERWGTYDPINDTLREHQPRWPADDDLLNLALIQAMATKAHVQVVPRADVPGGGDLAAVFRF